MEEKILYFFICLLELWYNEYNKSVRSYFLNPLPVLTEVCTC